MRFAAISAYVIQSMYTHIFHPTYVFGEGGGVREALYRQAEHDLHQERLCRSVLLSVCPDFQATMAESRVQEVVDDVLRTVGHLLVVDNGVTELEACAKFAQTAWEAAKKNKNSYHLSFSPLRRGDPDWATIRLPTEGSGTAQHPALVQGANDDVVAVVLPHIYVAGKPMTQLGAGIALRRYQTLAAKAELEEEDFRPPFMGTTRPKPPPGRARKQSVALVEYNGAQRQLSGKDPSR